MMLDSIVSMLNDCYQKFLALDKKHATGIKTVGFVCFMLLAVLVGGLAAYVDYLHGNPVAPWLLAIIEIAVLFGIAISFTWLANEIRRHASFRPLLLEALAARLVFFLGYLLQFVRLRIVSLLKAYRPPPPLAPSLS